VVICVFETYTYGTVKPGYTGHKIFVWAGQKKIRYKESSGIIIPALIQIIPAQFC
jgi:hypothetical protein